MGRENFFQNLYFFDDADSNGVDHFCIWPLVREILASKVEHFLPILGFFAYNLGTKEALSFIKVYLSREFNSLFNEKKIEMVASLIREIFVLNAYGNLKP